MGVEHKLRPPRVKPHVTHQDKALDSPSMNDVNPLTLLVLSRQFSSPR